MRSAVIVVNLWRSPQRQAFMRGQLVGLGLPFERLTATDGENMVPAERSQYYSEGLNRRQFGAPLAPAEIGRYVSQLRACQLILDLGLDHAVVLEDNVLLTKDFSPAVALLDQAPLPWDAINLGATEPLPVVSSVPLGPFELCQCLHAPRPAFALALSRRGAEKLLRHRMPFGRPFQEDLRYPWETGVHQLALAPSPVWQLVPGGELGTPGSPSQNGKALFGNRRRNPPLAYSFRLWRHNVASFGPRATLGALVARRMTRSPGEPGAACGGLATAPGIVEHKLLA